MAEPATVIVVDKVYKDFKLPHMKKDTLKSVFTSVFESSKKSFEEQHALKDISFEIKEGEFFGIVGRNGSGKSTLLKILAGIYQPTKGSVNVRGRLVPFIELGVGFNPELTGRENVYLNGALLGFSHKDVAAMYDDVVSFAELEKFMDQKLKNYSSGMQVRLAFSMAIRAEADILLIDEVLAVGDADFQRKCFDYFRSLKKNKKTVVFVSHDMTAVREYCDRAILIEKSELIMGGLSTKVATAYTRMFIDQNNNTQNSEERDNKRWGDGLAVYENIAIQKRVTDKDDNIKISVTATIKKNINNPVFGFSIKNAGDTQILGTNSQIKRQKMASLKSGDEVKITWSMPNVFNEGTHYVDAAIVHHDGSDVADWWEEAAVFEVVREERTPYIVSPPVALEIAVNNLSHQ
jgi:ABC-2 type transport system ATP-binding protein